MKYYLAQSIMLDPLPVPAEDMPSKYLPLHEKHIAEGIESGMVLFAGPKTQEGGGLFIARAESRELIEEYISRDPFTVRGLARFNVTEFLMKDRSEAVSDF